MPDQTPPDPETALDALVAGGGVGALLGDRDPVPLVEAAAARAGRPFTWVDVRGLTTAEFDRRLRGTWGNGSWELGLLSRALLEGAVFLAAHAEELVDDLRQRLCRSLLTAKVLLRGPTPDADRLVVAAPATTLLLHVDDHQPLLLQVYAQLRSFPVRIRIDVDGPPPPWRR